MSMGLAYGGQGFMEGMERSRQHRRQDRQDEQQETLYGLRTDQMRSDMEHQEHMRPIEREQAQLGLEGTRADMEHNEEIRPLQREEARLGLQQAEQGAEAGDMQIEAQRRSQEMQKILRRFAAGDVGAVVDWHNRYAENNITELGRTQDGQYHVTYDDGDDEIVTRDELGQRMAVMLSPEAWLEEMAGGGEPAEQRWHELSDGTLIDRRSGQTMTREQAGLPPIAEEGEGSQHLDSATLNTLERVSRSFWGTMNEQGQFILPEGSQQNYAETLDRAEALVLSGMNPGRAANVAAMSIAGPMNEDEARRQAEKEAREEGIDTPGMFGGGDREWLDQRTQEIMQESRQAEQIYSQTVGEQRRRARVEADPASERRQAEASAPQAQDREASPAPGGQYVSPNGQSYTQRDLEATARRHGVTIQDVIDRAGLRSSDAAGDEASAAQSSSGPAPTPSRDGTRQRTQNREVETAKPSRQGPGRSGAIRGQSTMPRRQREMAADLDVGPDPRPQYREPPDVSGIVDTVTGLHGAAGEARRPEASPRPREREIDRYVAPSGREYSMDEIRAFARQTGTTPRDVIRRSGLEPAER